MCACGGTHAIDMPWDRGAHSEYMNGLTSIKSSLLFKTLVSKQTLQF